MVGVDASGKRIAKAPVTTVLLSGTDSEIRGLLAKFLISSGLEMERLPRIIRAKRSQLYVDLNVAGRNLANLAAANPPTPDPDDDPD